ncbi:MULTISPECIES: ABC transporter ATP-binding protein [unclassified Bradyrhizobium]|uniref:ABC transporter ATP-binding protein n=1 Tax=unclassified Bradyrhizobium TaxID=2631580 RepID=UPI00247B18F1|nr:MULTISPECIES: ABC transporter ATP-binding protein [unclassified Bradyrhizobium]WGR67787.1 ABC transporter ATP-binding protein [Bradyrhizobium sp. ISRA426]WGR79839.1 ABC transporter ATP-binding protein [Bradyrhizobium sp. ISRA430]WGR83026.1 ABC transporter ATP-binding protein [Bradyrhizobium sp. ISRA432]
MNETIIEAAEIKKTLGRGASEVKALRGIDMTLRRGEFTLLMGPSGSGKTTLLLILGCMLAPSSGTLTVCGMPTSGVDKEGLAKMRRDHIGFVFQSYHLFPTLTAAQNVQLALDIRRERGRKASERALEALSMVGLEQKADTLPGELSGGEQQRVAIARAFVANPSVILADEPTAALDGNNGRSIMRILADTAHQRERAVLVVTHDPRVIPFADRIVEIEDGLLVDTESGGPGRLHLPKAAAFRS